jgi:hypothetical protein
MSTQTPALTNRDYASFNIQALCVREKLKAFEAAAVLDDTDPARVALDEVLRAVVRGPS